jgi:hypothetical protein
VPHPHTPPGTTHPHTDAASPYDLDSISDLQSLLWRHQHFQTAALQGGGHITHPVILVNTNDAVGLGNRLPSVVTGFVLALLTKRLFMLHSTLLDLVDLPFPARWVEHMGRAAGTPRCNSHWSALLQPGLALCEASFYEQRGLPVDAASTARVVAYSSIDYDVPLLQINPALAPLFDKFFPDGEVAHAVLTHLLRPKPALEEALKPLLPAAQDCAVGLHIRTRKYGGVRVKQFVRIARMLGRGHPGGSVFVASDANLFHHVQAGLPGRRVWWSNATRDALAASTLTRGNNPGTEMSAVLDMLLLSKCRQLVLTPASSLGAVAAALAGVPPAYANFGRHEDPFLNPWFWQSPTTEPCMFKASAWHTGNDSIAVTFRESHPLFLYHNQCHYQSHLRRVPAFLKQSTGDGSYVDSLLE